MDRQGSHGHPPGWKQSHRLPGMMAQANTEETGTGRPRVQGELRPCSESHVVKQDKKEKTIQSKTSYSLESESGPD